MFYGSLEGAAQACFSDLPLEEGIEYARQSVYQSAVSFAREYQYVSQLTRIQRFGWLTQSSANRYAGYADVDNVAYILCTEDKALPPGTQEQMISIINASRPAKSRAAVYKLATSHSPHVSAPEKLAELVVEAIRKFQ